MVEVLCNVEQQLLGVKGDRTERLGPRKNTGGGKRRPGRFGWGEGGEWHGSSPCCRLVLVIGLITTAAEHMMIENKYLLAPKSHGLYPNGTLVRGAGSVDPGEEEDPESELIENGILEVAVLKSSPLQGHHMRESVFWHIPLSV